MNKVIQIVGCVDGRPTLFDGKYVAFYDPSYHQADGSYDGGLLLVTDDPAKALHLPIEEALALWRKSYGIRADGKPNRPLTAYHVCIENAPVTKPERRESNAG